MIVHNFKVLKAPFEMGQHHCFKDFFIVLLNLVQRLPQNQPNLLPHLRQNQ